MNGLKRIRKKGTFASLPDITGRRRRKEAALPLLPSGEDTQIDVVDDYEQEVSRALKDDRLAKRVVTLLKTKHPYGTVPEMIMVDFLEQKGERYKYQAAIFGGYRSGGVVLDFVLRGGNAVWINGVYWHNIPGRPQKDAADKMRIIGQYFDGEIINKATAIWEDDLMGPDRERVMSDALVGIEKQR